MRIVVLLSCMNQIDSSIITKSNIQTDVVIVNQCDKNEIIEFDFENNKGEICHAKFINTTERGLSRSRNMAIANAWGDICLICDDDEYLEDNYGDTILSAYEKHNKERVIVFTIERRDENPPRKYPKSERYVGLKQLLQTSSVQITFKREVIVEANLFFDVMLGSGTGNGAGEETKFLMDCRRNNIKIYYVPENLGAVLSGNSSWFKGYTPEFMKNQGWALRRALGNCISFFYISVYGFRHKRLYKKNMSVFEAYKNLFTGYFENRH